MPLNSLLVLLVLMTLTPALPSWAQRSVTAPVPVELWHVGDDVLSERFVDAVDKVFGAATDFRINDSHDRDTLIVTVPTNIVPKHVGKRTCALYSVEFSAIDGRMFGRSHRIMLGR